MDIAISSIPEWGAPYSSKAWIHIHHNGDLDRAVQILKGSFDIVIHGKMDVTISLVQMKIMDGKYEETLKILSDEPENIFEDQQIFTPKSVIIAFIYGLKNNKNLEKNYYDLAIDKLEYLLSIPGELSVPYIKLDPVWQPLLKIPRFQEILVKHKEIYEENLEKYGDIDI